MTLIPPPSRRAVDRELHARVDAALLADPGRADRAIAAAVEAHAHTVAVRRRALGLPRSDSTRWRSSTRTAVASLLERHPQWSNRRVALVARSSSQIVRRVRLAMGLPPSPHASIVPPRQPSAVVRVLRALERLTDEERAHVLAAAQPRKVA